MTHQSRSSRRFLFVAATAGLAAGAAASAGAQMFEDVTAQAGINRSGESWGLAWGDFNGDGLPDVHVNAHRDRDELYRNNGDGTFTSVTLQVDRSGSWTLNGGPLYGDSHAAAWGDPDNDGDQDLLATMSNNNPVSEAIFMVNQGDSTFVDQAAASDLTNDGAGRIPVWFDFNHDGRLDVAFMSFGTSPINVQDPTQFLDFDPASGTGWDCSSDHNALLTDVNVDGDLDVICVPRLGAYPERVYDFSAYPGQSFQDITGLVPSVGAANEVALGDFDRNLRVDHIALRGRTRPSQALQINSNRVEAWVVSNDFSDKGFNFQSNGVITVDTSFFGAEENSVFIGSGGSNPASVPFDLDPNNASHQGLSGSGTPGVYIGYNVAQQRWDVSVRSQSNDLRVYMSIDTTAAVSNLNQVGFDAIDLAMRPHLLMNFAAGFQEVGQTSGLNEQLLCVSVAVGDFDNDMDEDLYIACRGSVENRPNRLFLNDGSGNFTEATSFGAEGIVGAGIGSGTGTADSAAVADFDVDGFLDIMVTNGLRLQPPDVGGPDQLFRNLGNANHWIELDLVGSGPGGGSNRDGVGAKVFATAGGVTQLREQGGGYHRWTQNHKRIHFGLGANTQVDITVEWPSGQTDTFTNVAADSLYRVNEGGAIVAVTAGPAVGSPVPQAGDECGATPYNRRIDGAFFVWKDCTTNRWFVRAAAGGDPTKTQYNGTVSADQGFSSVNAFSLENNDFVDTTNPQSISFKHVVKNNAEDGFDFVLVDDNGAENCLSLDAPAGAPIFVGPLAWPAPNPVNLGDLGSCSNVALSIDDVTVVEDQGVATFTVSLSAPSNQTVNVDYDTAEDSATVVVFEDDFETATGWVTNPSGTDTATTGQWERAIPEATNSNGPKQLGTAASGQFNLVTDGTAGTGVGSFDVDNGVTSIRSPDIVLPGSGPIDLSFNYYLAHTSNSSSDDFLRVTVVGTGSQTVFEELGSADDDDAAWQMFAANLDAFAGQTVHLLIEAADNAAGSIVEAGIDDVAITGPGGGGGFATADVDFLTTSGTLTFDPNVTTQTFDVPIVNDGVPEGAETFLALLSNPVNALIGDGTGVGTILDPGAGSAEIGDFIWDDTNGDGIQDNGEPGRTGVTVNLRDCSSVLLASTTSGAGGQYSFSGLAAGGYVIEVIPPAGSFLSPSKQGPKRGKDSDPDPVTGLTNCVNLSDGQIKLGVDAGLSGQAPPSGGSIGDFVWDDSNADGIQDAGEPGRSGVTVNLLDCGGGVLDSTVTDADGKYRFTELAAGSYVVEFIAPAGTIFSPSGQGPKRGKDSDADAGGQTGCKALAENQDKLGLDAGLITP